MTTIIIHNTTDCDYPRVEYPYDGNTFDALEEALYVWWELTPTDHSEWRLDLLSDHDTLFDYHSCEYVTVRRISENEFRVF